MRIILPLALVVLVLLGGGGLYGMKMMLDSKLAAADNTLLDLDGDNTDFNAGASALRAMFESVTGQVTQRADLDLRGTMPATPAGWDMREYEDADGFAITGHEMIRTAISKSRVNDQLQAFRRNAGRRKLGEVMTYQNGDSIIALSVVAPEQLNRNTVQGNLMGQVADSLNGVSFDTEAPPPPFATVDGIPFKLKDRMSRVGFNGDLRLDRHMTLTASLDGIIRFEIIAYATEADVAAVLQNIDMAVFQAMLPAPTANYVPDAGVQTAAVPATTMPVPGLREQAAAHLEKIGRESTRDKNILTKVVAGKVTGWDDIGTNNYAATPALIDLFGPEPPVQAVSRQAFDLFERNASIPDARFLHALAYNNIQTQADARKLRAWTDYLGEAAMELYMMLPEGEPAPQEVAKAEASDIEVAEDSFARPTVRRGLSTRGSIAGAAGSCKIENGVRRCVLGSDSN